MGSVHKTSYTKPMPENATVRGKTVTWTAGGQKRTGTMTANGRVRILANTYRIVYSDEKGHRTEESTGAKTETHARLILAERERTVQRILEGVMTRHEVDTVKPSKSLTECLDAFETHMKAKGVTARHVDDTRSKIDTIFEEVGIETLAGINRDAVEEWIVQQRTGTINRTNKNTQVETLSPRTINSYTTALKSFMTWCIESGRLSVDRAFKIKKLNENVDQRVVRRSLSDENIKDLLKIAPPSRNFLYRLLLGTGFRVNEARQLTVSNVRLDRCEIVLPAKTEKAKRGALQPITPKLAEHIREWVAARSLKPSDRLVPVPEGINDRFTGDLKRAKIDPVDHEGRKLDCHALRKTFGTQLARAGVPLTTTQKLMRHSTPELTARLYIDVTPVDASEAVAKLPEY